MKKYVAVVFNVSTNGAFNNTDKEYLFACYEKDVAVGDIVVVDTRYGFQLVTVTKVLNDTPEQVVRFTKEMKKNLKEVVCKVNTEEFTARKKKAEKLAELKAEKRAELKAEMDKRVKELQASAIYEMLAEKDDSLKQMLQQYKDLKEE